MRSLKQKTDGASRSSAQIENIKRQSLSYPKIEKAGCKGERKMKFFPEGFAEGLLSYPKIEKAECKGERGNEVFPFRFAEAPPA